MMKYGLIIMGHSIEPDLFQRAKNLPTGVWMRTVRSEVGDVNVGEIILAGTTCLPASQSQKKHRLVRRKLGNTTTANLLTFQFLMYT
jgi:hypothetical protein